MYPSAAGKDSLTITENGTGVVVLIIDSNTIKERKCVNCVLLLSVYSSSRVEEEVAFDIEVAQKLTIMKLGDTRLGYVEKGATLKYVFDSSNKTERIVSLSMFTPQCAIMRLYSVGEKQNTKQSPLTTVKNGMLVLPQSSEAKYYIVEVEGNDNCYYHITEVETKRRVYEFMEGIFYNLEISEYE